MSTDLVNGGNVALEQELFGTQRHPAVRTRANALGDPHGCAMKTRCPPPRLVVPAGISLLTHDKENESGEPKVLPAVHTCLMRT